ncbi:Histone deacetylase 5 [Acorus gramineus]|uniref:histone deacetylase n=1 Tax=Acorus gramineus TaxID=55184 RepID=A0AAV9B7V1_ACOGR|nr:Histone deacetylase 5 [Acorus gramineus]
MEPSDDHGRPRVGILYDERMCGHSTPSGEDHPENPNRIRAAWKKLESKGITKRCVVLRGREADDRLVEGVHTKKHVKLIKEVSSREFDSRRRRIASGFNSIYLNHGSSESAFLAAGSVLEVSEKVATGELNSAIALVRPPGHHAESDKPMGFCLFNNIAIAASYLLNEKPELGVKRILIVDWDVHHGNGTQKMFWNDPRVLYFSVHRFDSGTFYPSGIDGSHIMIGEGPGAGYNINVPWEHGRCGDADYLAVWDHILIPVAKVYNPDIILISGGFDAAIRDPLGGCCITPYGYSIMMKKLMSFARGKIVMALEGGYNLNSLANSILACAITLLGGKVQGSLEIYPFESTWRVIQAPDWGSSSDSDAEKDDESDALIDSSGITFDINVVDVSEDIIRPFSMLKVDEDNHVKEISSNHSPACGSSNESAEGGHDEPVALPVHVPDNCTPWRSTFSKIDVWYASYGSNMWQKRFLCYIEGGQVEGMHIPCTGSLDKSLPKETKWKTVPHRLFFARSYTRTWGAGGVAFLHPESNVNEKTHVCMHKITLEQFNDVLLQENSLSQHSTTPLFDLSSLDSVAESKSMFLKALEGRWYSNVIYLGKDDGIPILTMTCPLESIDGFRSGELPVCTPSKKYAASLVRGLVEDGKQLSEAEALEYINSAVSTPI